jgi:cytoskeletal protein RodZ
MTGMTEAGGDFGGRMRRLREERGVALRTIADITKISVPTLEALERNDIRRLPGGIFSRAVVRAYAHEVGADPETTVREFIERFPQESVVGGSPHVSHHDMATTEIRDMGRYVAIMAAIVVAVGALAFVVWTILVGN